MALEQLVLIKFEDSQKLSIESKRYYRQRTNYFYKNSSIKSDSMMVSCPTRELQNELTIYVKFLNSRVENKEISPNSIKGYFYGIKWLLEANGREGEIKWKQLEALYPKTVRKAGHKGYSTEQVAELLEVANSPKDKALIHFQASIGGRIGIHDHELLVGHLVPMQYKDMKCYGVLLYAEDGITVEEKMEREQNEVAAGESYWSFLTPEATYYLDRYLDERRRNGEVIHEESCLFTTEAINSKYPQLRSHPIRWSIQKLVSKSTVIRKRRAGNQRYDVPVTHGFRKRFNTILKIDESNINSNIAEKLMGHRNGLDGVYLSPTREQCFKEFCKGIPQLTVSDSFRKQAEIQILTDEKDKVIEELQMKNRQMQEQFEKVNSVMPLVNRLAGIMQDIENPKLSQSEILKKYLSEL